MNTPKFIALPTETLTSLFQFRKTWKQTFKNLHPLFKPTSSSVYIKMKDGHEIHLADLSIPPAQLSLVVLNHLYSHWESYQQFYHPLQMEALYVYSQN